MTHFASRKVAIAPTSEGYRVTYTAANGREAAEYAAEQNRRQGFPSSVVEVTAEEHAAIMRGEWNTYQPEPEPA